MEPYIFDPTRYPRSYRPTWVLRVAFLFLGLVGFAGLLETVTLQAAIPGAESMLDAEE